MATPAYLGQLEVEVKGNNGAYYKAFVLDILDEKVLVGFQDNWQPPRHIPLIDARLTVPLATSSSDLQPGALVEVFSRAKESEPCGWWRARVVQCKGEFYVIEYVGWDSKVSEIVERDRLRAPNRSPPLNPRSFCKCVIEVPQNVHFACEDMSLHVDLLKACHANTIVGNCREGTLTLLSQSEDTIHRARVLADIHVRNLHTKMLLKTRNSETNTQKTNLGDAGAFQHEPMPPDCHTAMFSVDHTLMGLAIGHRGSNIQACRQMPGIKSIEVDEKKCAFLVSGETEEAVQAARAKLEFRCECILVPREYTGRVIGRQGAKIQEIIDTSHVFRVRIDQENSRKEVPFVFIGRRESVDHAKVLVEYLLENVKELEILTKSPVAGGSQSGTIPGPVFSRETPPEVFAAAAENFERMVISQPTEDSRNIGRREFTNSRSSRGGYDGSEDMSLHSQGRSRYSQSSQGGRHDGRGERRHYDAEEDVRDRRRQQRHRDIEDKPDHARTSEAKETRTSRVRAGGHAASSSRRPTAPRGDGFSSRNTDWDDRGFRGRGGSRGFRGRDRGPSRPLQSRSTHDRDHKHDHDTKERPTEKKEKTESDTCKSEKPSTPAVSNGLQEKKGQFSSEVESGKKPNAIGQGHEKGSAKANKDLPAASKLGGAGEQSDDSGLADVSAQTVSL